MEKIIHFIKYHNAFTIGLSLVLLLTAGVLGGLDKVFGFVIIKVVNPTAFRAARL